MPAVYIIGDIHGQFDKLVRLLQTRSLIDHNLAWCGKDAVLWITGDIFDRGPKGKDSLRLVRNVQQQASESGGKVGILLGNHEISLLAARRFGEKPTHPPGDSFRSSWKRNGGITGDLAALNDNDALWLAGLPTLVSLNGYLLMHADALFYLEYGMSVEEINHAINTVLHNGNEAEWNRLLNEFSQREAFWNPEQEKIGRINAEKVAGQMGCCRIVHGHTPISKMLGVSSSHITQPLVYHQGLCVNVDGGMYLGGPGIVYEI